MKHNIVSVTLWGVEICRLEWQGGYKQRFGKLGAVVSFSPSYAKTPWDLDPLGPYNRSVYFVNQGHSDWCRATEYEGIPRFISSSLPDDWGNAVFSAWAVNNGLRRSDITAVDKLSFIGKRGMGALEFIPSAYKASKDDAVVLEQLYEVAQAIQSQREGSSVNLSDNPGLDELMSVGMSAGGMHPKAVVAIDWETGDVRSGQIELPKEYINYILKFSESGAWPSALIEYVYYQMALKAGIEMMPCRILDIAGDKHFLTQRFDRGPAGKVHCASLHSLCGPVQEYESIFRAARRLGVPHSDSVQLFRRAVFNHMAGVCDDHDKNTSFLMNKKGEWRLSPAYDVTFTVNLKNPFFGNRHAMMLAGKERGLVRDDFLKLAEQNDIRGAAGIIEQVADAVGAFSTLADEAGIEKTVKDMVLNAL